MQTNIKQDVAGKGILVNLYDPRLNKNSDYEIERMKLLHNKVENRDKRIGFGHVVNLEYSVANTKF